MAIEIIGRTHAKTYSLGVDKEGRAQVLASSNTEDRHINELNGKVWSIDMDGVTANAGTYVAWFQNTSQAFYHLTDMRAHCLDAASLLDVDEVIAQLLVSEGFAALDEVAYVEIHELADIEGFDEDTALELQTRAREYIEAQAIANETRRQELGVSNDIAEIDGITSDMLVAFGENDIKTMEDLAGCASDDLTGWFEAVDGERKRMEGILEKFDIEADEANALIMHARVLVGWVTEEELAAQPADDEEATEEAPSEEGVASEDTFATPAS